MENQDLDHTIEEITDTHPEHKTASVVKYTGLALFFIGTAVFLGSFFTNNYKLTQDRVISKIGTQRQRQAVDEAEHPYLRHPAGGIEIGDEIQHRAIMAQLRPMLGKTYSSEFEFISELDANLKKTNENLGGKHKINSYQRGQYRLYLTKVAGTGLASNHSVLLLWLSLGLICFGALIYFFPRLWTTLPGIQNDHVFHNPATRGKALGVTMGALLVGFYITLYWFPAYMTNWISMVDPLSYALNGKEASQWFLYGFLYTLAILVMGVRMLIKYRHSKYHLIRTGSVMFFQTAFAFMIPQILTALNKPAMDLKNIWPLHYEFFFGYQLNAFTSSGSIGLFMLVWGILLIIIAVPAITYFYGKRWYCSWVCGCGGLAETLGDPHRQLTPKGLTAWEIERWTIHSVLVFVVVMTGAVLYSYITGAGSLLGISSNSIKTVYGFAIGSIFAGVIGVGFYPFMGNRMWCRFGCPLAAYLGIVQRFKSRFRITTNGGQCISCGNCSTYCEMGIDVRWYAQRGQNIIRASCVGCGVCSSVCPRGVLRLETGPEEGRFNQPKAFTITDEGIEMNKEVAA